jgi:hypothetical protein
LAIARARGRRRALSGFRVARSARAQVLRAAILLLSIMMVSAPAARADTTGKVDVFVECKTTDPVGQGFCQTFKDKVTSSPGYRLMDTTRGYGMGVHFASVDMWEGINKQLAGHMSAIAVTFTIYSDKLPGEVYEDSSVFRVGHDAAPEMARQILAAVGQLVGANASFFAQMRGGGTKPAPTASP